MCAVWGLGLLMFSKFVVIFDSDVNIQDMSEVLWRIGNNVDPRRDTMIVDGPVDALEHASPIPHYGSKMGIDATRKGRRKGSRASGRGTSRCPGDHRPRHPPVEGVRLLSVFRRIGVYLEMVKVAHTVLRAPLRPDGMFLAAREVGARYALPPARTVFYIVLAMVGARTAAMGIQPAGGRGDRREETPGRGAARSLGAG